MDRLSGDLPGRFYAVSFAGFLWEMSLFMTQPIRARAVYVGFALLTAYPLVAATMLFFGACWGARAVTEWALLATIVPASTKTIAIGYMESFWDVGSSVGSLLAGVAVGILPYQAIFLLLAALNLPDLPAILSMKGEKR